jgi:hypothetical protein
MWWKNVKIISWCNLFSVLTYQDLCSHFASYSLENTLSKVKNHNLTLAPENIFAVHLLLPV